MVGLYVLHAINSYKQTMMLITLLVL